MLRTRQGPGPRVSGHVQMISMAATLIATDHDAIGRSSSLSPSRKSSVRSRPGTRTRSWTGHGSARVPIGGDESAVRQLAADAEVDVANLNSPGQIVISGERA